MLNDLRNKIFESNMKIEEFCTGIGLLYGDFSDRAAHRVPLPAEIKNKDEKDVLTLLELDNDEQTEKTIDLLIRVLKLVDKVHKRTRTNRKGI